MTILEILNTLAADNSRNFKLDFLKQHKDNKTLQNVCGMALDPFINFYIRKIPEYVIDEPPMCNLDKAMNLITENIVSRKITGNAAIDFLRMILSELTSDDAEVLERIIQKDLKCGCNESTINKIWPGLVSTYDVCLAHKDISHIKYPAYAQTKMDGGRCHMFYDGEVATCYTRNGKTLEFHGVFNNNNLMQPGETWDGEIVFFENGKAMDRKTSNGWFNKAVKGTLSDKEASCAVFTTWDIVDRTSKIPYKQRFGELSSRFKNMETTNIRLIYSETAQTPDEAQAFFQKCLAAGEEGAVLKNMDFKWEPKRVKGMGKMKAEEECDLLITEWNEGTGMLEGLLGALTGTTSDGKLLVNVGTGFNLIQRNTIKPDVVGKIMTVKYNQIIKSESKETWALFLPVFIEIREDKTTANSFDELK